MKQKQQITHERRGNKLPPNSGQTRWLSADSEGENPSHKPHQMFLWHPGFSLAIPHATTDLASAWSAGEIEQAHSPSADGSRPGRSHTCWQNRLKWFQEKRKSSRMGYTLRIAQVSAYYKHKSRFLLKAVWSFQVIILFRVEISILVLPRKWENRAASKEKGVRGPGRGHPINRENFCKSLPLVSPNTSSLFSSLHAL